MQSLNGAGKRHLKRNTLLSLFVNEGKARIVELKFGMKLKS